MRSRVLPRKRRRDLWRQRWQFLAAALVIAIGIGVYVGASDAYLNLKDSFTRAYAEQRLPDAVVSGPGAAGLARDPAGLPAATIVDTRRQGDISLRLGDHTFRGRAVEVPAGRQPALARLAVRSGRLPVAGEVVVEQHLADHYRLAPGDRVEVLTPTGWSSLRVAGSALSTEYFWPARSMQEIMTTPEHFGVLYATAPDLTRMVSAPVEQALVYSPDREQAGAVLRTVAAWGRARGLPVTGRGEQPSYYSLDEDVQAVGEFADLLPWVFLVAAVLGTYVLLSRIVSGQRAVIGTLAANGVTARVLRRHYLGFGVVVGLAGGVPGVALGYLLGGWFTTSYTRALSLPLEVTSVHPQHLMVGVTSAVVAACAAAWAPSRAAAAVSPAEAMRISPAAGAGRRSLLERLLPALGRLPARWRMTLRGVTRNRRRTLFTVLGVAAAVALVMIFAGLRDTVSRVIDQQFGAIQLEDAEVHTSPGADLAAIGATPGVRRAEPFSRHDVAITGPGGTLQTLLVGMRPDTRMHRFVDTDGRRRTLPDDGLLLAIGARAALGVDAGDRVTVAVAGGRPTQFRVAGFVDEPLNPIAYAALPRLDRLGVPPGSSGLLVQLDPGADADTVGNRIAAQPGVTAYLATAAVRQTMTDAFSLYDTLVGMMLFFAAAMAAALLYNAMSANVAERSVEMGTLRTAGMGTGLLARMVATENLLLVLLGIPLGLLLGTWAADWFMSTYETQGYHWSLTMSASTPAVVAAGVLAAALVVQVPALRAIRHLDLARIVRERSL